MVEAAGKIEAAYRGLQFRRRLVGALTGGHQQVELAQHSGKGAGLAVIPIGDALGGVAPAEKPESHFLAVRGTAFRGDFHEQATVYGGNRKGRLVRQGGKEHFDPLIKRSASVLLVGQYPWQGEHDFIDARQGGPPQSEMGNGDRVEGAGQNAEAGGVAGRASHKLHRPDCSQSG